MKLLFDQNISYRILKKLPVIYECSSHVIREGLINSSDLEVWEYARQHQFIIVTQDSDFNDIYLLKGFPPKILWLHTGNLRTDELVNILKIKLNEILEFSNNSEYGCFEFSRIR